MRDDEKKKRRKEEVSTITLVEATASIPQAGVDRTGQGKKMETLRRRRLSDVTFSAAGPGL